MVYVGAFLLLGLVAGVYLLPDSTFEHPISNTTRPNGELRSIATAIFDLHEISRATPIPGATSTTTFESPFASETFKYGTVIQVWPQLIESGAMSSLPTDAMSPEGRPYEAAALGDSFLLLSRGPNGVFDVTPPEIEYAIKHKTIDGKALYVWPYSPTNGSDSRGDILRYHVLETERSD